VTYAVTVTKSGAGSGTVDSSPAGIACGSDCRESFAKGMSVTLSAVPAGGSTFRGWACPTTRHAYDAGLLGADAILERIVFLAMAECPWRLQVRLALHAVLHAGIAQGSATLW
jgi:hypothetical protein